MFAVLAGALALVGAAEVLAGALALVGAAEVLLGLGGLGGLVDRGADVVAPRPSAALLALAAAPALYLTVAAWTLRLALRSRRVVSALLLALAALADLGLVVLAAAAYRSQAHAGYPGSATARLLVGAPALTAATLLLWPARMRRSVRARRPAAVSVAALLAAVVATVVLAAVGVGVTGHVATAADRGVSASTAPRADLAAVPSRVSQVAWTRPVPGLLSMVTAGNGVVARTVDGVLALDGRTGAVRWQWHRPGALTSDLLATPDGATLVLRIGPPGGRADQLVVLDAMTGRQRFAIRGGPATAALQLTDATIISSDAVLTNALTGDTSRVRPASDYRAWSVADGRLLWEHRTATGCTALPAEPDGALASFPTASTLVLTTFCGSNVVLTADQQPTTTLMITALDGATGQPRWEHDVGIGGPTVDAAGLMVSVPPDGAMLAVSWVDERLRPANLLLRADSGAVLHDAGGGVVENGLRVATRTDLADAVSGEPVASGSTIAGCALTGLALATGVVCVDPLPESRSLGVGNVTGAATVHLGTLAGPVATLSVALGGPYVASSGLDPSSAMNTPRLLAAPGGVIVAPLDTPLAGRVAVVTGLG